jgi:hypothetical protein
MAMAVVLLGRLSRTPRHGIHGGCCGGVFWTSRRQATVVLDCHRNGSILQWMVLCPASESRSRQVLARTGVKRMRVERERELRRRRKRHEKARKERRKAALMQAGKWPLTPIKT